MSRVPVVRYASPLRYPGGKAKLAAFVRDLMHRNQLDGGLYVEPYAGGASVALSLLLSGTIAKAVINDIDRPVYAFWHSVLHAPEHLCELISRKKVSVAEWHRQRAVQQNLQDHSLLELGFSTFFLNRANRSGIIKSGGMIGGRSQKGPWRIDARYNKKELIMRVQRIAAMADRISLHNEDASHFLRSTFETIPSRSLTYLDPPYYVKGTRRLYANAYTHSDHLEVAEILRDCDRNWLVSYDDCPEIRRIYKGCRTRKHELAYTASERYRGAERLFFSPGLRVPSKVHSREARNGKCKED